MKIMASTEAPTLATVQSAQITDESSQQHQENRKTITNELLNEFLDSHAEINIDLMDELRTFEEFLDNESNDLFNDLVCSEVILNKHGALLCKCNLCEANGHGFISIANYEDHLHVFHSNSNVTKNVSTRQQRCQSENADFCQHVKMDGFFVMEKQNFSTLSKEFFDGFDKSLERCKKLDNANIPSASLSTSAFKNIENCNDTVKNLKDFSVDKGKNNKKRKKRTPGHCQICQRSFNDLYNLRVHMMIHTGEKPYQCEDCGKKFRQYNKLKIHRITHTNKRPFICDICGKGFRFRNYLSVHKRLHSGEKPYKCKFCDEHYHSLHTRRLHMKIQHAATQIYTCPQCGKVLTSQCYLTAHMKRHNNQRDYECDKCAKRFFSLSQLKDHQLSHTEIKPFECHICSARFQRKSNFNQHLKIHSNVKSYICSVCKKAFAQNAGLYGHMKSHA